MAAGLGFKTFTTGEVLTAADTNGYLMQGVLVFASAAARDAAITSPQEGQCCYLKDTDAVLTYSGAAWVGFDDTNAIQNSIVDAKGDLIAASSNDTPARLAVGTNDYFLQAASGQATGLQWGGTFSTYTPVLNQNGNIATSTATGRYIKIGKFIHGSVFIIANAAGSAGQRVQVTLPFAPQAAGAQEAAGGGSFYDASSFQIYPFQAVTIDSTYFNFTITQAIATNGNQYVGITGFTAAIAAGDQIGFRFSYEVG